MRLLEEIMVSFRVELRPHSEELGPVEWSVGWSVGWSLGPDWQPKGKTRSLQLAQAISCLLLPR